jgi:hypothetical protein
MKEYEYVVQLPLAGGGFYDVCTCASPQYLAAVVQSLAMADVTPPAMITILIRPLMERR